MSSRPRTEFNERFNISHLPEDLPKATTSQVIKHLAASVAIYGVVLLLFIFNPWFKQLLSVSFGKFKALHFYYAYFICYIVVAPVVYLIFRPRSLWRSKNLLIIGYLSRIFRLATNRESPTITESWKPDYNELNALMFLVIKIIYGPLMLNSAMFELRRYPGLIFELKLSADWLIALDRWYLLFVTSIFFVDSTLFFIGYHTEMGFLKNKLKYAETNLFRILVCIACYAPFNMVTANILGPSNHDVRILFMGDIAHPITWVLRGLAALFLLTLISASTFLFTKASNLTNRGIVKTGPYAVVRHPGYISKNLFWLMTLIPLFIPNPESNNFSWTRYSVQSVSTLFGLLGWGTIYYLRAITEEQFLRRDPEYVEYCRKVKYRFIPGVI
ncbi:MAG: hypothetical protein K9N48_01370 [Verrucomicrobia bacterium]|nr:hypothetical protein [Verrucomicrobiota bacterium]MCF7707302.1 hypothetical protein [Verrucomicrobiota bacterium]